MIRVLQSLFDHNNSSMVNQGSRSEPFPNEYGLLQGSTLSPLLYAMFINDLPELLRQVCNKKDMLGSTIIASFMYADDIALVANDPQQLKQMLDICEAYSMQNGVEFAPNKCEIISGNEDCSNCTLYGEKLKICESFTYLGVSMNQLGINSSEHAKRMIMKVSEAAAILRSVGCNAGGLGLVAREKLYISMIRPILEYGLTLCTTTQASILYSCQHKILCSILGVSTRTSAAKYNVS